MTPLKQEILFEFIKAGHFLKASALDPVTSIEVSIMAPIHAPIEGIKKILIRKLRLKISHF